MAENENIPEAPAAPEAPKPQSESRGGGAADPADAAVAGGRGGGRGRRPMSAKTPLKRAATRLVEKVVFINRSSKVVKGGRRFKFSALVVVGDKKGKVGIALGKAAEVADAIRRGGELARTKMVSVSLKDATIPHEVYSTYGGAKILLRPASPGTGIIAGKTVRAVLESAGVKDILTKSLGSKNAANVVKATLNAPVEPPHPRADLPEPRFGNQKSGNAESSRSGGGLIKILCDCTILNPVPARNTAPSGSVRANPAATAKRPVAVARARPRVPAARSASVLKAARCRSSAASPSAVSTTPRSPRLTAR